MGESLTERRRVEDEGLRVVNSFSKGRNRVQHGESDYTKTLGIVLRKKFLFKREINYVENKEIYENEAEEKR
jgi:hypothetical protein